MRGFLLFGICSCDSIAEFLDSGGNVAEATAHVVRCSRSADLSAIHNPEVDLVIWERKLSDLLRTCINELPNDLLFEGTCVTSVARLQQDLYDMLRHDDALRSFPDQRELLTREIHSLVELFRLLYRPLGHMDGISILCERQTQGSARAFHCDASALRLFCTLQGLGPEGLPRDYVDFEALRSGDSKIGLGNLGQAKIHSIPVEQVGVWKGRSYPNLSGQVFPWCHRAPKRSVEFPVRTIVRIEAYNYSLVRRVSVYRLKRP